MRMAYDKNGSLMVDRGLGWTPVAPAPSPGLGDGGDCGCGRGKGAALGAAETGAGFLPIVLVLGGIWALSKVLS